MCSGQADRGLRPPQSVPGCKIEDCLPTEVERCRAAVQQHVLVQCHGMHVFLSFDEIVRRNQTHPDHPFVHLDRSWHLVEEAFAPTAARNKLVVDGRTSAAGTLVAGSQKEGCSGSIAGHEDH